VRAVNLVPGDQRRGGAGSQASTPTYVLLGALTAIVIAAAAYVLTVNTVNSRKTDLSKVSTEATSTAQQAATLRPYRDFAALRQTRVATVASLAASRFDWERTMSELARALPGDVWLTSLVGTVAPGVTLDGNSSGGDAGSLRSSLPSPAVEVVGCTDTQAEVSRVMARLRLLHGVTRVSLASSEKNDTSNGPTGASGASAGQGSTDCRNGSDRFPQFQIVVFFDSPPQPGMAGGTVAPSGAAAGAAPTASTPPVTTPTSNGTGQ
jgi:Tfp pilus assembly protein PilN